MKNEPMTPLVESSAELHEWYTALVQGGFESTEALTIIAKCIPGWSAANE